MVTKYGAGTKVQVQVGDGSWIDGEIFRPLSLGIFQVQTAQGYLTVKQAKIRLPEEKAT